MDIAKVKSFDNMQNTFMFYVQIPNSVWGLDTLEFFVRSTTIPEYRLNKDVIRYMNLQTTQAGGKVHDSEWSVTAILPESFETYNALVRWFNAVSGFEGMASSFAIKSTAYIKLLGLDKTKVNKRMKIYGIYPLKIPSLDGLDMSQTEGHISLDIQFAFDYIDYDEENLILKEVW